MTLSHGNDMATDKDGNYGIKHKTEVTAGCPSHDIKGKLTLDGKGHAIRINHHASRDPIIAWNLRTTCQPQDSTWDVKVGVKHGGVQVGPVFPWSKVSYLNDILNLCKSYSSNSPPQAPHSTLQACKKAFSMRMLTLPPELTTMLLERASPTPTD